MPLHCKYRKKNLFIQTLSVLFFDNTLIYVL